MGIVGSVRDDPLVIEVEVLAVPLHPQRVQLALEPSPQRIRPRIDIARSSRGAQRRRVMSQGVPRVAPIEPDDRLRHQERVLVDEGSPRERRVERRGYDAEEVQRRGRHRVVADHAPDPRDDRVARPHPRVKPVSGE